MRHCDQQIAPHEAHLVVQHELGRVWQEFCKVCYEIHGNKKQWRSMDIENLIEDYSLVLFHMKIIGLEHSDRGTVIVLIVVERKNETFHESVNPLLTIQHYTAFRYERKHVCDEADMIDEPTC